MKLYLFRIVELDLCITSLFANPFTSTWLKFQFYYIEVNTNGMALHIGQYHVNKEDFQEFIVYYNKIVTYLEVLV